MGKFLKENPIFEPPAPKIATAFTKNFPGWTKVQENRVESLKAVSLKFFSVAHLKNR